MADKVIIDDIFTEEDLKAFEADIAASQELDRKETTASENYGGYGSALGRRAVQFGRQTGDILNAMTMGAAGVAERYGRTVYDVATERDRQQDEGILSYLGRKWGEEAEEMTNERNALVSPLNQAVNEIGGSVLTGWLAAPKVAAQGTKLAAQNAPKIANKAKQLASRVLDDTWVGRNILNTKVGRGIGAGTAVGVPTNVTTEYGSGRISAGDRTVEGTALEGAIGGSLGGILAETAGPIIRTVVGEGRPQEAPLGAPVSGGYTPEQIGSRQVMKELFRPQKAKWADIPAMFGRRETINPLAKELGANTSVSVDDIIKSRALSNQTYGSTFDVELPIFRGGDNQAVFVDDWIEQLSKVKDKRQLNPMLEVARDRLANYSTQAKSRINQAFGLSPRTAGNLTLRSLPSARSDLLGPINDQFANLKTLGSTDPSKAIRFSATTKTLKELLNDPEVQGITGAEKTIKKLLNQLTEKTEAASKAVGTQDRLTPALVINYKKELDNAIKNVIKKAGKGKAAGDQLTYLMRARDAMVRDLQGTEAGKLFAAHAKIQDQLNGFQVGWEFMQKGSPADYDAFLKRVPKGMQPHFKRGVYRFVQENLNKVQKFEKYDPGKVNKASDNLGEKLKLVLGDAKYEELRENLGELNLRRITAAKLLENLGTRRIPLGGTQEMISKGQDLLDFGMIVAPFGIGNQSVTGKVGGARAIFSRINPDSAAQNILLQAMGNTGKQAATSGAQGAGDLASQSVLRLPQPRPDQGNFATGYSFSDISNLATQGRPFRRNIAPEMAGAVAPSSLLSAAANPMATTMDPQQREQLRPSILDELPSYR